MRVLIAGCGDVGTRAGLLLADRGHEVFGLRRDPTGLPAAISPVAADLTHPASLAGVPGAVDVCLATVAAGGRTPQRYEAAYVTGLRNLVDVLRKGSPGLGRLLFTSSTAVYGDRGGDWIDETTAAEPESFTGEVVLRGESIVLQSSVPTGIVLRLGGIYGPGRTRLLDQVDTGAATIPERPTYTNRIHADDAARALVHLALDVMTPDEVYLGVDDDPAERGDVIRFLAELMGAAKPTAGPASTRGNKRCRNDRLRSTGFEFLYPSYREGYAALIAAERSDSK